MIFVVISGQEVIWSRYILFVRTGQHHKWLCVFS